MLEGNGDRSDGMIVRPSLVAWEHCGVDFLLEVVLLFDDFLASLILPCPFAIENHGTSWASERLMCSGCDDVAELKGIRKLYPSC